MVANDNLHVACEENKKTFAGKLSARNVVTEKQNWRLEDQRKNDPSQTPEFKVGQLKLWNQESSPQAIAQETNLSSSDFNSEVKSMA